MIYKLLNRNRKYKYLKKIFISLYFILFFFIFFLIFNFNYKNELTKEILDIEKFYKVCNKEIILKKSNHFKNDLKPKISIISTIYNKEKYILRFLRSVQNQNYENVEIILIDDFSEDKSILYIEKFQKEDERIKIIKHSKNKGTLISRNEGIFLSKGKYIFIPDIDDILSINILNHSIIKITEKKSDFIIFNTYLGNKKILMFNQIKIFKDKKIFQHQFPSFIFLGDTQKTIIDPILRNKLFKKEVLIKALNSINDFFLIQNMIFYEDTLLNFMIYKVYDSFFFFKKIGYFYIPNKKSLTRNYVDNQTSINRFLYSFFIFLKFILHYTKNDKYEKSIINLILLKEMKSLLSNHIFKKLNNNLNFYINILDLCLKNKFISSRIKKKLIIIKQLLF